ncbi:MULTISPECIES: SsgA family sporulation/cell division regulator [unclassified Modestobacter]|uniref:SsgA family sporulation/cell division regulator n=1 Tax=unclassified Modestobacter TaxID=2643866 RepID=UPI0022AA97A3|nr:MULTISPECIES: SsgA family sporulation/cell division regulator [unclassified Modestobacter]MCZ2824896.1 SsgA family sporulation/cell division regulator [Modestobacter sp. VKM Ac-2981]MCZ2854601.1 SsgA family sporulation/cell division regulator [Modestobacter sp. VKM Ac-2982]
MPRHSMSGCTARTTFHLIGPQSWTAVPAALVYDSTDPFAVRVRFGDDSAAEVDVHDDEAATQAPDLDDTDPDDEGSVEWLLSRDLLRAGLIGPVGEGDVRLWPARNGLDVLFLQLRAPSGEALFEVSGAAVGQFLRETDALVPVGAESELLQVDEELTALLRGGTDNPTSH